MAATVPSRGHHLRRHAPSGCAVAGIRRNSGCSHQIEDARNEAEQHEHDEPPRRESKPPIEHIADHGSYQHARHQLGGEPQAACHRRTVGGRPGVGGKFGTLTRPILGEPVTETPEPRGESSLIGKLAVRISFFAWVVAHHADTRSAKRPIRTFRPLKAARTILTGSERVKNR
jgi:hypothetical protein